MNGGVRARIEIESPGDCPVATASVDADARIDRIDRATGGRDGVVAEEFAVDGDAELSVDATPVASEGDRTVYRFERDRDELCACDLVEHTGPPLADISAADGGLKISFRAADVAEVRAVVAALDDAFDGVHLRTLSRGDDGGDETDAVVVDRSALTDRQRRVLKRAHELGYFEYPKGSNASEVAEDLGIARSTFTEHLAAAQSKLYDAMLEGGVEP
ncbi:MAG TPA: helix-turn-helix domain-containing protein [Natronoarchaeum rubrum]|nr:helix-turn-helix domain-containing protein [Natronoarchaeum rubrum]